MGLILYSPELDEIFICKGTSFNFADDVMAFGNIYEGLVPDLTMEMIFALDLYLIGQV